MKNLNYKVTEHFKINEFACKDGTSVPEKYLHNVFAIAIQLEVIRLALGQPVYISSAYRTISYNAKVGGALRSQHLTANAVDIQCKNISPQFVFKTIQKLMRNGDVVPGAIILYKTFVHYDMRGTFLFLDKR